MYFPFTQEQFVSVFVKYNTDVWPAQIVLTAMAVIAVLLTIRATRNSSRLISLILGGFWLWMGIIYHLTYFRDINPAAIVFGIAFIAQGLFFLTSGALRGKLFYQFRMSISGVAGLLLIFTALVIYPLLGSQFGHTYPTNPTFGLPCPTTIFTLGMILLSTGYSGFASVIPILWSVIGFMAALSLGMKEDYLLIVTGIITALVLMFRRKADGDTVNQRSVNA